MKQLTVLSGKGGTGKTSITAGLAALAGDAILADCDVDAPDLHLVVDPQVRHRESFTGGKQASILPERCKACGRCSQVCRFEAISLSGPGNASVAATYRVDSLGCEGCLACVQVCPAGAIQISDAVNGEWYISDTRLGPMVHAQLFPGHENSGRLVSLVRSRARQLAGDRAERLIIIDGSPGIGCPVIASVSGTDLVLAVTEPTCSGLHDLRRILGLARHFGVPSAVCVNRWDLNPQLTERIEQVAREEGASVAGRVRHDRAVVEAQLRRLSVVEHTEVGVTDDIRQLWDYLGGRLLGSELVAGS